jgi:phage-related protein
MSYEIKQWPGSVSKSEIGALPLAAESAVLLMLKEMAKRGPMPQEYGIKPLKNHLHGLKQANLKVNKEQIRVLFSVYGSQIVVFHVFKKTSPQVEKRGYQKALDRKKQAETLMGDGNDIPTIH